MDQTHSVNTPQSSSDEAQGSLESSDAAHGSLESSDAAQGSPEICVLFCINYQENDCASRELPNTEVLAGLQPCPPCSIRTVYCMFAGGRNCKFLRLHQDVKHDPKNICRLCMESKHGLVLWHWVAGKTHLRNRLILEMRRRKRALEEQNKFSCMSLDNRFDEEEWWDDICWTMRDVDGARNVPTAVDECQPVDGIAQLCRRCYDWLSRGYQRKFFPDGSRHRTYPCIDRVSQYKNAAWRTGPVVFRDHKDCAGRARTSHSFCSECTKEWKKNDYTWKAFFDQNGTVLKHFRKKVPGWASPNSNPNVYGELLEELERLEESERLEGEQKP